MEIVTRPYRGYLHGTLIANSPQTAHPARDVRVKDAPSVSAAVSIIERSLIRRSFQPLLQ